MHWTRLYHDHINFRTHNATNGASAFHETLLRLQDDRCNGKTYSNLGQFSHRTPSQFAAMYLMPTVKPRVDGVSHTGVPTSPTQDPSTPPPGLLPQVMPASTSALDYRHHFVPAKCQTCYQSCNQYNRVGSPCGSPCGAQGGNQLQWAFAMNAAAEASYTAQHGAESETEMLSESSN